MRVANQFASPILTLGGGSGGGGAALTWYLTDASAGPGSDLSLTDPGAEAYRSPATGWIVGTATPGNYSAYFNDVERAAATFADQTPPSGTLDTSNGDFWVSPTVLTGAFASANWEVHACVRAQTGGGANTGRARCRLFRGANQDGSSATEITSAQQVGTTTLAILTSGTRDSVITFNPGVFSVAGEYIFIQIAWDSVTASGVATHDANFRIGNASSLGSRVVTAAFA